jgi:2-polyprenyl-6-methoxyphenol hydroxylase-like FAD-dependent oxidoreductase
MATVSRFENLVILGNGYSALLTAIALAPVMRLQTLIGPSNHSSSPSGPDEVSGQHAHSHIFLPRLAVELTRIDPKLLSEFDKRGLRFSPGSKRLTCDAPLESERLFATRWQFDQVVRDIYRERITAHEHNGTVKSVEIEDGLIRTVLLIDGERVSLDDNSLVVDATGARSPIMQPLIADCEDIQDHSSNIAYISQFFRLQGANIAELPDPLIECAHDFGIGNLMLYPAIDGWFSVTIAISTQHREMIQRLRRREHFLALCRSHPHVKIWLSAAQAVGPCRVFMNPRNRWNTAVFCAPHTPANYLAVGDALASTVPTLGANCSFAASHIRIVRDLAQTSSIELHKLFFDAVHKEQFEFFQQALQVARPSRNYISYENSPENQIGKRIKKQVRKFLGLDRARIIKQLTASSTL